MKNIDRKIIMRIGFIFCLLISCIASVQSQDVPNVPSYIMVANSGTSETWEQKGLSWNQTYHHNSSTPTIDETYPLGSQLSRSRYNMFATMAVPPGTIYHIYNSPNNIGSGSLSGLPEYTLVLAENPDGTKSVIYTARRGEENEIYTKADGTTYQAFDAQCIFGTAGYDGARQEGNSPSLRNNIAFLWEGGGFGPGYSPNMALREGHLQWAESVNDQAHNITEGLTYQDGQWTPSFRN